MCLNRYPQVENLPKPSTPKALSSPKPPKAPNPPLTPNSKNP